MDDKIKHSVYTVETANIRGFSKEEIRQLLKKYPNINKSKFYGALDGVTGILDGVTFITYHVDIENALRCGIENRDLTNYEWD